MSYVLFDKSLRKEIKENGLRLVNSFPKEGMLVNQIKYYINPCLLFECHCTFN